MELDTPAKRLKHARSLKGWTQHELARRAELTPGTIGNIEAGSRGIEKSAVKLAKALGVRPEWLATGEGEPSPNTSDGPQVRSVPLLNKVTAGDYRGIIDAHSETETVQTVAPVRRYTYALRIEGDSMEPTFTEGMVVIIEPDMEAQPNDYVVAVNQDNEATFKQLVRDDGQWLLKPLNPRYPIRPLGNSTIAGVCIGAHIVFKRFS